MIMFCYDHVSFCYYFVSRSMTFFIVHTNNSKSVFFIHESMREMFSFWFDLVCFGRYLQFEQYMSGIICIHTYWPTTVFTI